MAKVRIRNIVGNAVSGKDFYGRERIIKDIRESIKKESVLLSAPRRFGKTSIMKTIYEKPPSNFIPIFIDVEGMSKPAEFISQVMAELYGEEVLRKSIFSQAKALFAPLIGTIEQLDVLKFKLQLRKQLEDSWFEKGKDFFNALARSDKKILFLIDEIPLMVRRFDKEEGAKFLHWLRVLRQPSKMSEKVRWIFGSSIGFIYIIRELKTTTEVINDLKIVRVAEFEKDIAKEFVRDLLKGELRVQEVEPSLIEVVMEEIEVPIPFFLQVIVSEIISLVRKNEPLTSDTVRKAYTEMLKPYNRSYFEHYNERLNYYYNHEIANIARQMLSLIAQKGDASQKELENLYLERREDKADMNTFSLLLSDLQNDFYIVREGDSYRFSTKVLRDLWNRYYGWREE